MTVLDPNGLAAQRGPDALRRALDEGAAKSLGTEHCENGKPNGNHTAPERGPGRRKHRSARENASSGLPVIRVTAGKMPQAADEAESALIAAEQPIFKRSGMLVRPVVDEVPAADGKSTLATRLKLMCPASMADYLAKVATFQRFDQRRKDWVNIDPPPALCATLLARDGQWRLPPIAGIITTPTLRADGTLLTAPGYDPATRLFLAPDTSFRLASTPEAPTQRDAETALDLLKDLLSEFPFAGPIDRAVALAGLITAVVRGALPTAPLFAIRSPTPGTGKSLLVDVAAAIATGRRCPVIAAGKTPEETEKRLGALLLEAVSIISLDNVSGELGGDTLCQMTERPLVRTRILGESRAPELECRATVFATGNNLVMVGDMTRRALVCTLDAGMERPELRTFKFDPIDRALSDRGAYVAAILTIVRAYRAAGSPNKCGPIGSYGKWSDTVRAPLVWLGVEDPLKSMETARDEDPELTAIREVFNHWRDHLGLQSPCTTAQVIEAANMQNANDAFVRPEFRDSLLRIAGEGKAISSKRLGKWLSRINGRVVDEHRIEMQPDPKRGHRFSLCAMRAA